MKTIARRLTTELKKTMEGGYKKHREEGQIVFK